MNGPMLVPQKCSLEMAAASSQPALLNLQDVTTAPWRGCFLINPRQAQGGTMTPHTATARPWEQHSGGCPRRRGRLHLERFTGTVAVAVASVVLPSAIAQLCSVLQGLAKINVTKPHFSRTHRGRAGLFKPQQRQPCCLFE